MEDNGPVVPFGTDPTRYRSYLLRLWREAPGTPWRCQVQCVGSGRVLRFEAEARLFEFLEAELGHADQMPAGEGKPTIAEGQAGADARHVGRTAHGLV